MMFDFLATLWSLIGIFTGLSVLFLIVVGIFAVIGEAVKKYGRK